MNKSVPPLIDYFDNNNLIDILTEDGQDAVIYEYDHETKTLCEKVRYIGIVDEVNIGGYTMGDLDGDGWNEVVIGHAGGRIFIVEAAFSGYEMVFEYYSRDFPHRYVGSLYNNIITNDIDRNGKKELLVFGNMGGFPLYWFEADCDNSYKIVRKIYLELSEMVPDSTLYKAQYPCTVNICDQNNDGIDDLAVAARDRAFVLNWDVDTEQFNVSYFFDFNNENVFGINFFDIDSDAESELFISTGTNTIFYDSDTTTYPDLDNATNIDLYKNNINRFILYPTFPNPFNPSTKIKFDLPKSEFVSLKVYNMLGEEIVTVINNRLQAGNHTYEFDGSNLASGVYLYRIEAGEFQDVRKMVLIK